MFDSGKRTMKQRKEAFLAAFEETGFVRHAANAAKVSTRVVYLWRKDDPEFAEQWDALKEQRIEVLEQSLYQRAVEKDTIAAIFLLKGAKPEVYRDNYKVDVSGNIVVKLEGDAEKWAK